MKIRCSNLDRIAACPASAKYNDMPDLSNQAAEKGTFLHTLFEKIVNGESIEINDAIIQSNLDLDFEDVYWHLKNARDFWESLNSDNVGAEVALESVLGGHILTGTADVMCTVNDELIIIDWKTGAEYPHYNQLCGYGFLAMLKGLRETCKIVEVYTRTGTKTVTELNYDDAKAEVTAIIENINFDDCRPSDACKFCRGCNQCPAYKAVVLSAGYNLTSTVTAMTSPAALAELYPQYKLLKAAIDRYEKALKIAAAVEPIEFSGGTITVEQDQRESIIFDRSLLEIEGIDDCLSVSKTELKKVIMASVKSQKGAAWNAFLEGLKEKNLTSIKVMEKLKIIGEENE